MATQYLRLDHGKDQYRNYFVINWCFFSICNYSCSYCPTTLHDGKQRGVNIEVVKNFCLRAIQAKPDQQVFIEFTGGEMTYYKHFAELFAFLKQKGAETGLISNGSRSLDFWHKHKHLIDHICLSFHPEQGDANHFFEVVKLLNEVTTVHVNIMMLPEQFEGLYQLASRIASEVEHISIAMQPLFENMDGKIYGYSQEQKEILDTQELPWGQNIKYNRSPDLIRKVYRGEMSKLLADGTRETISPPELIARRENNWFGWQCQIGIENLVIDAVGNIKRGWCGVGGILGMIQDPNFKFPVNPITCNVTNCYCGLDIMATKFRST
jgi:organic radical activating enzyme